MTDTPDELSTEELVGWRGWEVQHRRQRIRLVSLARRARSTSFIWHPDRWTEAFCPLAESDSEHVAPMWDCTCGLYAARSRAVLVDEWGGFAQPSSRGDLVVMGRVGFAGKVVVSERVYRAQRGRVLQLWVPHVSWRLVEPLRLTYRVPVELGNPFELEEEG